MIARLYAHLGTTHDERIVSVVLLVLALAMPFLFAGAVESLPPPQ